MKRIGVIIVVFISMYCGLSTNGASREYIFEQISPDEGFAFDQVSSIVEDEYGFIWFGCFNGLYHFNSQDIVRYNFDPDNENSIPSDKVRKLYRDWQSTIWICTEDGLCYFDAKQNDFVRVNLSGVSRDRGYHHVLDILQYSDSSYLVIVNGYLYKYNRLTGTFEYVNLNLYDKKHIDPHVVCLYRDDQGEILLGATRGRVYKADKTINDITLFYTSDLSQGEGFKKDLSTICQVDTTYWLGFRGAGIEVIGQHGKLLEVYNTAKNEPYKLPHNRIQKIIQQPNKDIWVATFDGIHVINKNGNHTIRPTQHNKLPLNIIFDLYLDRNQGTWVGTWNGGLAYYSPYYYRFEHVKYLYEGAPTPRNVISSFAEWNNGDILVGSENLGLFEWNPEKRIFVTPVFKKHSLPFSHVESVVRDQKGTVWIGTFNEGLWKIVNGKLEEVKSNVDFMLTNTSITAVDSGLWIGGTGNGLYFYDFATGKTRQYKASEVDESSLCSNRVRTTFVDSKGNLWVCTNEGLSLKKNGYESFINFYYSKSSNSISSNVVYCAAEDSDGMLWFGTSGGGIDMFNLQSGEFSHPQGTEELAGAYVFSIVKDFNGDMWIASDRGVLQYVFKDKKLRYYTSEDGISGNNYNPNAAFVTSKGRIFFGGANGFIIINPKDVIENPVIPEIFLSKLLINYQPISEQDVLFANSKYIADLQRIELKHNQNSLVFSFVANNFIKSSKNRFRYRIKNYLDDWIETTQGTDVSLAKIPPGNYVLEITGANNDGKWNSKPKQIEIVIKPPFWFSGYAYFMYACILILIAFWVTKELAYRERIRNEMLEERYKHEAEENLFAERTKFFTNISHELRTPLTLILSPLNNLIKRFENEDSILEHLNIMKRNAERLLRLTNQILDFRLIELGKVSLNVQNTNAVELCKNIAGDFELQLKEKEMNYIFSSAFKSFEIMVDGDKLERVVYNLISNAIKYSDAKGQLFVSIDKRELTENDYHEVFYAGNKFTGAALEIKVKDTGKGIAPEKLPSIFERFSFDHSGDVTGTGIGLHICQEYIRLQQGNIMVESEVGKGSTFIINLPVDGNAQYQKDSIIIQSHVQSASGNAGIEENLSVSEAGKKVVLFAEDNDDLRIYMKNVLVRRFKVLTAKNGHQALEIACEIHPDIVISDIMMPGIDGIELTNKLKCNPKTKHIPIILITALTESEYQIDSMEKGADLFLTKPVDEKLLLASIDNILNSRESLRKEIDKQRYADTVSKEEESFQQRAIRVVEDNLQNPFFDIEIFSKQLGISRSSLHRKIKAETNLSPSEFIRDVRLNNAVKLMKKGKYNIDEIGSYVGFNSTSYFIRSFKKKYGQTPKEYYTQLKKKE